MKSKFKFTETLLVLLILFSVVVVGSLLVIYLPEKIQGFNETGYVCDYLSNGTSKFYYCELKLK